MGQSARGEWRVVAGSASPDYGKEKQRRAAGKATGINGTAKPKVL